MIFEYVSTGFFRFVTKHAFDRRTDRQKERPCNTVRCIACGRAVKISTGVSQGKLMCVTVERPKSGKDIR